MSLLLSFDGGSSICAEMSLPALPKSVTSGNSGAYDRLVILLLAFLYYISFSLVTVSSISQGFMVLLYI